MVAASPLPQDPVGSDSASVEVRDDALVVHELVETDSEVLRVVREASRGDDGDALDATRQCLRVGARAVLAANVSVETHIVEKRFDAMSDRFDEQVETAVARISEVTSTSGVSASAW